MPLFTSRSAGRASGSRRALWLAPLVLLGGFIVFAKLTNTNPPTNSASTSHSDTTLQTRTYEAQLDAAAKKIASLSLSTYGRGWRLAEQNHIAKDEVQLVFHVPVIVFTDVLTVSVRRKNDKDVEVDIESHSQVGKGDFGENRRHVLQMLSELDTAFG